MNKSLPQLIDEGKKFIDDILEQSGVDTNDLVTYFNAEEEMKKLIETTYEQGRSEANKLEA